MGSRPERTYDPARMDRSIPLAWDRMGPGGYAIVGSTGTLYYVNLNVEPYCSCPDMAHRNAAGTGWCKHALKAAAVEGIGGFREAMGDRLLARQRASGDEEDVEDEAQHGRHGDPC